MFDPLGLILASSARNSRLDCASATNSSRFLVPYAVPSKSLTSLYNVLSCLVSGCEGLANVAEVNAWPTSCSNVCCLIPLAVFKRIVLVLGSNEPARLSLAVDENNSTFVSPMFSAKARAKRATSLSGEAATIRSAPAISPSFSAATAAGWISYPTQRLLYEAHKACRP